MRGALIKLSASIAILVVVMSALMGWQAYRFIKSSASGNTTQVVFTVDKGQSLREVARRLEAAGLITDSRKFRVYARLKSLGDKIRVGEYALNASLTPGEILSVLSSGKSIEYVVTVSEGLNRFEIADIVERIGIGKREDFLRVTQDREFIRKALGEDLPSLEGYLFPETYYVTRASGVQGLVKQMVIKFNEQFARVPEATSLNKHQLITLASIIEKETGAPEERPLISSVFHNRLRKGMRLQTDPTVIYGLWLKSGMWNRNISRQDLVNPSPYNTYVIPALPPGPIANPGIEALIAAARPAKSEFLFFVSRNDGTHTFSKEYSQHRAAVGKFQLDKKAREGKSWRDLQKRNQKKQ